MLVVFLAFWSLQGHGFTWCLGGNGLESVSTFPTLRTADNLRLVAGKHHSVLANDRLRKAPKVVVSRDVTDLKESELRQEVLELRRRVKKLTAVLRLALALLRSSGFRLTPERLPNGGAKLGSCAPWIGRASLCRCGRSCGSSDCHRVGSMPGDGCSTRSRGIQRSRAPRRTHWCGSSSTAGSA